MVSPCQRAAGTGLASKMISEGGAPRKEGEARRATRWGSGPSWRGARTARSRLAEQRGLPSVAKTLTRRGAAFRRDTRRTGALTGSGESETTGTRISWTRVLVAGLVADDRGEGRGRVFRELVSREVEAETEFNDRRFPSRRHLQHQLGGL